MKEGLECDMNGDRQLRLTVHATNIFNISIDFGDDEAVGALVLYFDRGALRVRGVQAAGAALVQVLTLGTSVCGVN